MTLPPGIYDPERWEPDFETVEMPAEIVDLQTIDGIVYAVLKGGTTVPINPLIDHDATGTMQ